MAGSVRSSKSRYNEYLSRFRAGEAEEKQNRKDGKRELPMQRDWTAEPSSRGKRRAHRPAFMLLREFWKLLGRHHTTIALALCTITISTLLGLVLPLSTKIAFDFIITDHPGPTGLPPWAQVSDNRVLLLLCLLYTSPSPPSSCRWTSAGRSLSTSSSSPSTACTPSKAAVSPASSATMLVP